MTNKEQDALLATAAFVLRESGLSGGRLEWRPTLQNSAASPFNEHTLTELEALAHRAVGMIARCRHLLDTASAPSQKTIHQFPSAYRTTMLGTWDESENARRDA